MAGSCSILPRSGLSGRKLPLSMAGPRHCSKDHATASPPWQWMRRNCCVPMRQVFFERVQGQAGKTMRPLLAVGSPHSTRSADPVICSVQPACPLNCSSCWRANRWISNNQKQFIWDHKADRRCCSRALTASSQSSARSSTRGVPGRKPLPVNRPWKSASTRRRTTRPN